MQEIYSIDQTRNYILLICKGAILAFFLLWFHNSYAQDLITDRNEYFDLIDQDTELYTLYKLHSKQSNTASTSGVVAVLSMGLAGLSAALNYEANSDTSKALTSGPTILLSIIAGFSGTIAVSKYLESRKTKRGIDDLLLTKYNRKLDLTWEVSSSNFGLGLSYLF